MVGVASVACCRAPALSHEQPPGLHSATTPSMFTPQTLNFAQLSLVTYQSEICTTLQKSNNVNTSFDWNSKSRWIIMAWEIKHYLHKLNSPTFSFTSKWKELNTVKNLTIVEKLYAFITAPSFLNFLSVLNKNIYGEEFNIYLYVQKYGWWLDAWELSNEMLWR